MTEPPKHRASETARGGAREVVLLYHPTRPDAHAAATSVHEGLTSAGLSVRAVSPASDAEPRPDTMVEGAELVVVLGGDGSILTGTELARPHGVPVLGVNLGHVGFLAEAEPEALPEVVRRIVARDYLVEERMTVDVTVRTPDGATHHGWALNEAAVEKGPEGRMVEAALGVDGRGLSTFACDAVVLATPTGSTAYAFSAGGPIVWPGLEALLVVPVAAHALFTRPMVVGRESVLEVEILAEARGTAVVRCDGRRTIEAPPGSRIEVRRGTRPALLALLSEAPFSGRLVAKFDLPVTGWRGGLMTASPQDQGSSASGVEGSPGVDSAAQQEDTGKGLPGVEGSPGVDSPDQDGVPAAPDQGAAP
ncbi:NAD kinase [Georgenia sp. Z1344]|uniref:NAD kinase n=1 Tax=Georgenia sp. Z1344 TaxID=3416706 RepID=UPI003CEF8D71